MKKKNHSLIIQTHSKLGIKGNLFNLIKHNFQKPAYNFIFNGESLNFFPTRLRKGKLPIVITFIPYCTGGLSQLTMAKFKN